MTKTQKMIKPIRITVLLALLSSCGEKQPVGKETKNVKVDTIRTSDGNIQAIEYYCNDSLIGWVNKYNAKGRMFFQAKYFEINGKLKSNEHLNYRSDGSLDMKMSFFFIYPNLINNSIPVGNNLQVCVSDRDIDSIRAKYTIYEADKLIYEDSVHISNGCFYIKTDKLKPGEYTVKANISLVNNHYKEEYEKENGLKLDEKASIQRIYNKRIFKKFNLVDGNKIHLLKE